MESDAHSVKTATHLVATEKAVKMSTNAATVLKDVVMAVIIRLGPIDVHAPTDIYYIRMAKLAETLTNVRLALVAVRKYAPTTVFLLSWLSTAG
ncbi:hypothetical protein DPMN_163214 [Dreissena polymorpha]|uniref:Uncharacterized protein n=2 Tax=Dreissena polymorpha TaxID=45954 RepID=A0A9D4EST0_DREPO|nr:hypothetical protein DPMN_163214 [Dreissena polymorpha]